MSILALDISTSIVGYAFLAKDKTILSYGAIKTPKTDNHILKMDACMKELASTIKDWNLEEIVVEEALQKLSSNNSSAKTIIKLVRFNFCLSFELYKETGIMPKFVPAVTARAQCGIKIPKGLKGKEKKEFIRNEVDKIYPTVVQWKLNKKGNIDIVNYDIADAIVIGRGHCILNEAQHG